MIRTNLFTRWETDERGNVAIVFAMMAIILMLAVGAAVDVGRWLHARDQTISAVDAALLAAGRYLQTNQNDPAGAIATAQTYYAQNVTSRLPVTGDSVSFVVGSDGMSVTASGTAYMQTSFLNLAGVDKLPLISTATTQFSQAQIAVGGNGGQSIEISLVLDETGSMVGQKLTDLQAAAKAWSTLSSGPITFSRRAMWIVLALWLRAACCCSRSPAPS
jgi:Flp pilus assembly protein TadG